MKPVDPAEISALLDDALPPERAGQVRRALAEDSELRRVYENLSSVHRDLAACGAAARFRPRIVLTDGTRYPAVEILGLALVMLALRVTVKFVPWGMGIVFQAAALAVVLWWVTSCLLRLARDDRWRLARSEAAGMA